MTETKDPNRADQKVEQPADANAPNDNRQDATAVPADEHNAAEKSGTEKPELETPARENLERVGVDAEHKTEAMRKHQRGTFP